MASINLLKKKEISTLEDLTLKKHVWLLTIIISISLVIAAFVVIILSLNLRKETENALEIEKKWLDKISSSSEVESYAYIIRQKLDSIIKISSPIDFSEIFTDFVKITTSDLSIVSMGLNKDGVMSVDGDSSNSASLLSFFDGISNNFPGLKSAALDNIVLSKDGVYRFSLSLKFGKKK